MNRRSLLAYLCSTAVVPPFAAFAQSQKVPLIGFLNSASPDNYAFNAAAFREGLAETGYVDGQNATIEYRWARGNYDLLPALATELVNRNVAVIAATGDIASARGAQAATRTIPIVFTVGADPTRMLDTVSIRWCPWFSLRVPAQPVPPLSLQLVPKHVGVQVLAFVAKPEQLPE